MRTVWEKGDWAQGEPELLRQKPEKEPPPGILHYILPRDGSEWFSTLMVVLASVGCFAFVAWQQDLNYWVMMTVGLGVGYVGNVFRLHTP